MVGMWLLACEFLKQTSIWWYAFSFLPTQKVIYVYIYIYFRKGAIGEANDSLGLFLRMLWMNSTCMKWNAPMSLGELKIGLKII